MPWTATALEWLKLPLRVLWGLAVADALILWGPRWFITGLGLEAFIGEYRNWLGVAFLLLLAAIVPPPFIWIYGVASARWQLRQRRQARIRRLHDLSDPEKAILQKYVLLNTRTQTLDMADGVTRGLQAAEILALASNIGQGMTYFDYNIQPWAWNYLREHQELVIESERVPR